MDRPDVSRDQFGAKGQKEIFLYGPIFKISVVMAYIAGALIVAVSALVSLDVIFRIFGIHFSLQSFELARYAFAISIGLGLAYTLMSKGHIRIDILYNFYPRWMKRLLDILALFAMTLVAYFLAEKALELTLRSFRINAASNSASGIPLGIPQFFWTVGLVWFAAVAIYLCIVNVKLIAERRFAGVEAMLGYEGHEDIPELDRHEGADEERKV